MHTFSCSSPPQSQGLWSNVLKSVLCYKTAPIKVFPTALRGLFRSVLVIHVTAEVQRAGGAHCKAETLRLLQCLFFSSFLAIHILPEDMATQYRSSLLTSLAARCGQWRSTGQWDGWIRWCGSHPFSSLFLIIPSCILMLGMSMPLYWTIHTGPRRLLKADCLLLPFVYLVKRLFWGFLSLTAELNHY